MDIYTTKVQSQTVTDFNNLSLSGFQEPEARWANNKCNDEMFHDV